MPKQPWWTIKGADPESQQLIKGAMEKGASSWLSALPIKTIGYALNKQEFTDAICMRYGWKVKGIPTHYACGETNSVDHSLICKLGGYTSMRHNSVRDSEAQIMRVVCRDVQTEPTLLPINGNDYERKVNTADNARLDIFARGLWNSCEKTFVAIRITHPTSQSYSGKPLAEIYQKLEKEKDKCNQRVIAIEKSSFNPLVFTTSGGMAAECNRVNKRLAEKIAEKRREPYASVITYIHKDKAQTCTFEEHPHCNTRILRQAKWCPPPGAHGHWLQPNS